MYHVYFPSVKVSFLLEVASRFKLLPTLIKTTYATIPSFFFSTSALVFLLGLLKIAHKQFNR